MSIVKSVVRRIVQANAILFVCDVQDRFRNVIYESETLISKCSFMNKACNALDIPCIITEQYPKAFGSTVPEILAYPTTQKFEKKKFSMLTDEVSAALVESGKTQVVLCGIEAHVCVLQSALDLVGSGYEVFLVADAVSSQRPHDRAVAIQRMMQSSRDVCGDGTGALTLTTAESLLFDMMRTADHPNFKQISGMIKEQNAGEQGHAFDLFHTP
eukprot:CAMPEP_0174972358 /NCGR_PEP_ID=MMETSP0004_2-20121128/10581_1 /TAXON_ID=420556 /ORGANISM="Ochromonas sp., Strain CCMP1393" /LENGTH=213 /DNA_ID=CAMNT_0016222565 /DNA_START=21 /DNA_END=662 /DNA_ORIENTATION=+